MGRAVVRLGFPAYTPASAVRWAASRRRTTNSTSVRTRKPTDSRRIKPVTWSSRSSYIGVKDKGCPLSRPMALSTRSWLR